MKKTLITLLALSTCAMAETVVINSFNGNNYITSSSKQSLTLTSTIDADALETIIGTSDKNIALLGIQQSDSKAAVAVASYSYKQSLRIFSGVEAGTGISQAGTQFTWTDALGQAVNSSNLNEYFTTENIVAGAITLGYNTPYTNGVANDTKGLYVAFSVLYENGTILTLCGHTTAVVTSGQVHVKQISYDDDYLSAPEIVVTVDNTDATVTSASVLAANLKALPTIPEPATATLSLLALCGLCARRRRH